MVAQCYYNSGLTAILLARAYGSLYAIRSIMPFPPPAGGPLREVLIPLIISPLPLGAFYISAKFVHKAFREETAHAGAW